MQQIDHKITWSTSARGGGGITDSALPLTMPLVKVTLGDEWIYFSSVAVEKVN